jgi:hypothetical protein
MSDSTVLILTALIPVIITLMAHGILMIWLFHHTPTEETVNDAPRDISTPESWGNLAPLPPWEITTSTFYTESSESEESRIPPSFPTSSFIEYDQVELVAYPTAPPLPPLTCVTIVQDNCYPAYAY